MKKNVDIMTDITNWDEETYDRVFDDICGYVEKRKQDDDTFSINDLKQMIDEAYQRRGMDWIGKGHLQFVIESATIAALEQKYVEWNKECKKK
jgi:hypothetical protein